MISLNMTEIPLQVSLTTTAPHVLESSGWHGMESVEWAWHLEPVLEVSTLRHSIIDARVSGYSAHCIYTGLRLDIGYTIDVTQADVLSYEDSYVDVYSNSWGPSETGFSVGGPRYLTRQTFQRETKQVCTYIVYYLRHTSIMMQ